MSTALNSRQRRAAERKQRMADMLGEYMGGYVVCDCGSSHVTGHDRRDPRGRIVQVVYRCHDCGQKAETPRAGRPQ